MALLAITATIMCSGGAESKHKPTGELSRMCEFSIFALIFWRQFFLIAE